MRRRLVRVVLSPERGDTVALSIEPLTAIEAGSPVDHLLREYLPWVAGKMASEYGVRIDDFDGLVERHHATFATEMAQLLAGRGRLLLARVGGQPAGVAALKPIGQSSAEIKRVYVRPAARGRGIGRALLLQLIADARAEGCRSVRLETTDFMVEALNLYRSLGFVEVTAFEDSEMDAAGLASFACYMELVL
jgi:ribosomal protein S18 acetylase RimI-like enzyme